MAKFIYSMENVLRIKERIEEQKRMELGQAMVSWQEAVKDKEAVEARLQASLDEFYGGQKQVTNATKLQMLSGQVSYIEDQLKLKAKVVARALNVVEIKRDLLKKALEEKKIQEKLREKAYDRWYEEEKQKQQQLLDELVGYRYAVKEEE